MGPLRVMAVINGLGTGGAERSLAEMLPLLRDRGIEVHVVCSYEREHGVEGQVRSHGFRVTHLRREWFLARVLELRGVIRAERPDLIHTTIIESDILGRLAAMGAGIPVVTSLVNTSYAAARLQDPSVNRLKLEGIRLIDGFTARKLTAGFHAITEAVAQDAISALRIPRLRITVIGRGRDLDRLGEVSAERRASVRRKLGVGPQHEVVVAVGRQEYQKGQIVLVDVAAKLSQSHPHLQVLLVGRPGSETQRIQQRVDELGLQSTVLSLGHRDDLPDLLVAADIFAFPSIFEGLGGSLLEAMAMGLPCVVSDIPAFREIGRDRVTFAKPGDANDWTQSLAHLLSSLSGPLSHRSDDRATDADAYDLDRVTDAMASWYRVTWRQQRDVISAHRENQHN